MSGGSSWNFPLELVVLSFCDFNLDPTRGSTSHKPAKDPYYIMLVSFLTIHDPGGLVIFHPVIGLKLHI